MALKRYVALLRAINVGGHAVIKQDRLKAIFESFGLSDVSTYIQSGNVLFSIADTDAPHLATRLTERLAAELGYPVTAFVFTPAQLVDATAHNPFEPEKRAAEQLCHLMFLSAPPSADRKAALMKIQGDDYRFYLEGRVLYYAYDRALAGHRRTIDFERVLGVTGTARTWNVVNKLIELAGSS